MHISVSVIIPTYDRPSQTLAAVESVLNQTRPPEKVLVIDDGSPDASRELLVRLLQPYSVEVLFMQHSGHPGRVRNFGLNHVETTHVAFLDSDDLWMKEKLGIQEELARSGIRAQGTPYVIAGSPLIDIDVYSRLIELLTLRDLLRANSLCNSSVFIESELLRKVGGLPTSYGVRGIEDYAAWLRVAAVTDWTVLKTPLVIYSDTPDSSMRSTNHFSIPEGVLALWDFASWLSEQGRPIPHGVRLTLKVSNRRLEKWASRQSLR